MTETSERTMPPDGQIASPLDKAANREPFVNKCKGALYGAAYRNALGFHTMSAIGEPSQTIARVCYIRSAGAL